MRLTIVKFDGMDDWYIIERAEHDGRRWIEEAEYGSRLMMSSRVSDADIEGYSFEMVAIAAAIESRSSCNFRRCAVNVRGVEVDFWSPRNSRQPGTVSLTEADELAKMIRTQVKP